MGSLSPWHWAILLIVLVLLFGAKKLPDAARSVGRSMKILKAETKGLRDDDEEQSADSTAVSPDNRQLPQVSAQRTDDTQVADLQRQLDELKKQQTDQAHKNAS